MVFDRDISLLLLEDDASWVLIIREMLENTPGLAELSHCSTIDEAQQAFARHPFDVLLLDLQLEGSSGLNTLRTVLDRLPRVPIVVLTGRDDGSGVEAVRMGAQDHLDKATVDASLLARVIRFAVERHTLLSQIEAAGRYREMVAVQELSSAPVPKVTSRLYSGLSLRESRASEFGALLASYRELLGTMLEERLYKTGETASRKVADLAERFGTLRGGPRDVLDVHVEALREAYGETTEGRRQALVEEGRILVLNLMGHLAGFYRNYYPTGGGYGS